MRRVIWLPIVFLVLSLFGCGQEDVKIGGVPRAKYYHAIISLSPSVTELLVVAQATVRGRVIGRMAADNWPPRQYETIPVIGSVKPDYEKIASLRPDLVVYDSSLYGAADVAKIKALGTDTYAISADTIDEFENQLYGLTNLLGGETLVSDYIDRINDARARSASVTAHPKVAVLIPGTGSEHMIAGKDSFVADEIRASGGTPVGPAGNSFVPLDAEMLVSLNPDYIVSAGLPDALLADPRLRTIKAIANKKIVPVNADIILRRGSRVDQLIHAVQDKIAQ